MHRRPTAAAERVEASRGRYGRALDVVTRRAVDGDTEGVLRAAVVAAQLAWNDPIGQLHDPRLEELVVTAVGGGRNTVLDGARSTGRVLHVLSEAFQTGGHTRFAWRWMARDPRSSDVALTNQRTPVPDALVDAAAGAGGAVHDLRTHHPDLLDRARALRHLMAGVDLVVLHVHPYDAVALAASALPGPRPPIVLENHADFCFWLGLAGADVVSDHRVRAQELSRSVRRVPAERSALLPLPLDARSSDPAHRAAVRRALGLADDDVLGVSIATPYKMAPVWGVGFEHPLAEALRANPRLHVVLVGPDPGQPWASLAARSGDRLRVVGMQPDPFPWLAAADLYLDSYPLPSVTSVLEAAVVGLPVLTLADLDERTHGSAVLFQAGSPGLDELPTTARNADQYASRLRRLVRDPRARAELGAAAQAAVLRAHSGDQWTAHLEDLYAHARAVPLAGVDGLLDPTVDTDYAEMLFGFQAAARPAFTLLDCSTVLGEQSDPALRADLVAVEQDGGPVTARVSSGWETQPGWTLRLLGMAAEHPALSVSFPLCAQDGGDGAASAAVLTALLAELGQDSDTCGDLVVEDRQPDRPGARIAGELALVPESLDALGTLLASPMWRRPALVDR